MPMITRHEFLGSWIIFWVLCVTIILIPPAIIYPIQRIVTVEEEIDDPQAFITAYRSRTIQDT